MGVTYRFFPWVRQGVGNAIKAIDPIVADLPGRVSVPVKLSVNDLSDAEVEVKMRLYGPGDITGIDQRQIVRTDPPHLTTDFEPNYFPAVDFHMPDFPWLFTPATGDEQGRLRPWICLIVVRVQDGVSLKFPPNRPLPVLHIKSPARPVDELPNLTHSWAWAHSQVVSHREDQPLETLLASDSPQNVSRLIAPRKLEANQHYYACLVPTFEVGRKRGLGLPVTPNDENELKPAWSSKPGAPNEIALPVYYHWTFRTGTSGDFESLASLLEARPLPPGVGIRNMDVSQLPFQLPDLGVLGLEGALCPPGFKPKVPKGIPEFRKKLREIINLPTTQFSGEEKPAPVIGPRIYGRWQASQAIVPGIGVSPHWLRELNLDPRSRAIAGFGTLVVQDQQEQLMASAWEQLGDKRVNELFQRTELALAVGEVIHKRLHRMSEDELLQFTKPIHTQVRMSPQTLHQQLGRNPLLQATISAPFRRIVRADGPVMRRLHPKKKRQVLPFARRLAVEKGVATVKHKVRPGMISFTVLKAQLHGPVARTPEEKRFQKAAATFQSYFETAQKLSASQRRPKKQGIDLSKVEDVLKERVDPGKLLPKHFSAQLNIKEDTKKPKEDSIEPIMNAPTFSQPMYESLRDLSQELLLPGLENIPPNSITLLETNPRFVEAYLVGLNNEMSRELLWREFPSNQRATYFQKFWDDRGDINGRKSDQIAPIHLWEPEKHLGQNFKAGDTQRQLVLLMRGELLRRYPNATIYAANAIRSKDKKGRELGKIEKDPIFTGRMEPDVIFFGFDLTAEEARGALNEEGKLAAQGSAGWFFVIQQQPTEPRFGLDVANETFFGKKPVTWNQLSWGHLVDNERELKDLTYVDISGRLAGHKIDGIEWGFNPAHMARITLQKSVRIAIHAGAILPTPPKSS